MEIKHLQWLRVYMDIMLKFFVIYSLGWVLSCFVRNDSNPALAMYAMAGSAVVNVVLDYVFIFIFDWGMKGAAIATGISQVLLFCTLLIHFISNRGELRINLDGLGFGRVRKILSIGLPMFFIEMTSGATSLMFNHTLLKMGNDFYVTVYGIVVNVAIFVLFLLVGIGQACQPIISFNHGADAYGRVRKIFRLGLLSSLLTGILAVLAILILSDQLVLLFGFDQPELLAMGSTALRFHFLAFPIMAVNIMVATLLQATEYSTKATLLSIGRGFVFVILGLQILPVLVPGNGVWLSVLFSETLTLVFSVIMLRRYFTTKAVQSSLSL